MKEVVKVVVDQFIAEISKEEVREAITTTVSNIVANCVNIFLNKVTVKN